MPKQPPRRETMQPPPMAPIDVEQKYKSAKRALEEAFVNFHSILNDKVLDNMKSTASKKTEQHVVNELAKSAVVLDQLNIGEGVTAIAIIAIREHLKVRDRVNELEYELEKLKQEMLKFKKDQRPNEKPTT